ncbi:hypothetical protein [Clostridium sp.]|uniref:hypothetical protein n=1 Tax=Clostridium sp. TaxID=1506 RepID=UPI00283C25D3|nr:hypothetical protein [Clostridium sp.]MDR3594515.1 hypothetical protein [Clostridium sp.]
MNKKTMTCMIASLIAINCIAVISKPTTASTASYSSDTLDSLTFSANMSDENNKNKSKGFNIFSEENHKYLSSEQKKALLELKKCKDKGESFSEDQQKTLNSIVDSIVKGKLGEKNYQDFKCLTEKKRSNNNLTEEENKRLKEYYDYLDGTKHTALEILNQFLR